MAIARAFPGLRGTPAASDSGSGRNPYRVAVERQRLLHCVGIVESRLQRADPLGVDGRGLRVHAGLRMKSSRLPSSFS